MHLVISVLVAGMMLGRGSPAAGDDDVSTVVAVSFAYDDNALLGRRGQFLDSPDADGSRQRDLAARQVAELGVERTLGARDRLRVSGRLDLALARTEQDLRGFDAQARAEYERDLGAHGSIAPEVQLVYHREAPEWSYRALLPQVRAVHQLGAVQAQVRYQLTAQTFAQHADGTADAKNSYANIDMLRHLVEADLRLWKGTRWRGQLVVDAQATRYAGNLDVNLADYAGLEPGTPRRDRGAGATASLLAMLGPRLLLGPGARAEINDSNSDAFAYRAGHLIATALWAPADRHSAFLHLDVARYDFPRERFDRRYLNTRRDYRREINLIYEFAPTPRVRLAAAYRRLDSISNDCAAFDPQRDELGLPVYSRSYSCYGQNRLETSIRYEF